MFVRFFRSLGLFYLSFLIGNAFGTFLIFLRKIILWDGAILILLILFFEFLNFLIYKKKAKKFWIHIQLGILLGFFIDAFKVGS